ncbi:MAG: SDR family NAD(P)-dependent oxidoreductase [Sphaerochaeta sp.]|jgi:NAD(P)-dependent dehydrogenase (short-subunit alcohol dehydrogenase family)|uniref:SDR family NAD(P)-dependent oxidoreductase n=1 Tax=Sphaerochaeta sp. TaxID=1972642 RepID=UPI002FC5ECE8
MQTVLVSGGTSTLGKEICTQFVHEGAIVYCGYSASKEKAEYVASQLGPSLRPLHLDVQDQRDIEQAFCVIENLDVLVNNSGLFSVHAPSELAIEEWERIFDINVTGMFRLTKQALPLLRQSRGCIINIASINALHPGFGGTAHYDASKGAVLSFTRSLAKELAPEVRVNAVAPGLLKAPYLDEHNPIRSAYENRALLKRLVDPAEVASAVGFLTRCKAMTAEVITIDCGYLMG